MVALFPLAPQRGERAGVRGYWPRGRMCGSVVRTNLYEGPCPETTPPSPRPSPPVRGARGITGRRTGALCSLSCHPVALAPVDGVEGVADDRLLAVIDDRGLLRDPDDIAGTALEDLLAGAQPEQPLE